MDEQPDRPPREGGPFVPGNLRSPDLLRATLVLWAVAGLLLVVFVILVALTVTGR